MLLPKDFVRSPEAMAKAYTVPEAASYTRWLSTNPYESFQLVSFLLPNVCIKIVITWMPFAGGLTIWLTRLVTLRKVCVCSTGGAKIFTPCIGARRSTLYTLL